MPTSNKRSKQSTLTITGGPRAGDLVQYGQPLPKTLVLSSDIGYVDYARKGDSTEYEYADDVRNR